MLTSLPETRQEDIAAVNGMFRQAIKGWYTGDEASLAAFGGMHVGPSRTAPQELYISLLFSKDRMHHSVGWWRNAEYEYCWHLSIAMCTASDYRRMMLTGASIAAASVDIPELERRYWANLIFGKHVDKIWLEPGGTDPRLTPREKRQRAHMFHLRVFLNPLSLQPFIPKGEVYHLTRWIPGLTPEKVDR